MDTAPYGLFNPKMPSFNITEAGVHKLLHNINLSKAGGLDGVPCRMLKELAEEITLALTFIFTQSLATRGVQSEWKKQWISSIYKKGKNCEASNYRSVSLTCVTSKPLKHAICSHKSEATSLNTKSWHGSSIASGQDIAARPNRQLPCMTPTSSSTRFLRLTWEYWI